MREAKDLKAPWSGITQYAGSEAIDAGGNDPFDAPLVSQHPLLSVTQFTCWPYLRLWHAACGGCTIL